MTRISLLLSIGLLATGAAVQRQDEAPAPPGRLVDVGGHRLHIRCSGTGSPTVIIDGGAGVWSTHYAHIQDRLAADTRVCTYDRAGLGWSDTGPTPRTSGRLADELHSLLHAAGVVPPIVMVGHSLGGYNVRIYQSRYPEEVAAVVLVESAHPQQWAKLPPAVEQLVRGGPAFLRERAELARAGKLTAETVQRDVSPTLPEPARRALIAAYTTPKPYLAQADEFEAAFAGGREVPSAGLGAVPLVVLTARNSYRDLEGMGVPVADANRVWLALQRDLASLSSNSNHVFSDGTHNLHETDAESFGSAIMSAVGLARRAIQPAPALGLPPGMLAMTSTPQIDDLLARLETAYRAMDADAFVSLFSEDVVQLDVGRRVHIKGREAWAAWTRDINAAHLTMERRHRGRARAGDWVIVEVEWSGRVRGEAAGTASRNPAYRYTGLALLRIVGGLIREQVIYGDIGTLTNQVREARAHQP